MEEQGLYSDIRVCTSVFAVSSHDISNQTWFGNEGIVSVDKFAKHDVILLAPPAS